MNNSYEFNRGDVFPANCNSCYSFSLHTYLGIQEGYKEIPSIHLGNCGGCGTTTRINIPVKNLEKIEE